MHLIAWLIRFLILGIALGQPNSSSKSSGEDLLAEKAQSIIDEIEALDSAKFGKGIKYGVDTDINLKHLLQRSSQLNINTKVDIRLIGIRKPKGKPLFLEDRLEEFMDIVSQSDRQVHVVDAESVTALPVYHNMQYRVSNVHDDLFNSMNELLSTSLTPSDSLSILPSTLFHSLLHTDFSSNHFSFAVYLFNPSLTTDVAYAYESEALTECPSAINVVFNGDAKYIFIDLRASSSRYGSFVPKHGFRLVHIPHLLTHSLTQQPSLNPMFLSEMSWFIHSAVTQIVAPNIHQPINSQFFDHHHHHHSSTHSSTHSSFTPFQPLPNQTLPNLKRSLLPLIQPISIEIVVVVMCEEPTGFVLEEYVRVREKNDSAFWRHVENELRSIQSQGIRSVNIRQLYHRLSKSPTLSLSLLQSISMLSHNDTSSSDNIRYSIDSHSLITSIHQSLPAIWNELQFTPTNGTVLLPVFIFSLVSGDAVRMDDHSQSSCLHSIVVSTETRNLKEKNTNYECNRKKVKFDPSDAKLSTAKEVLSVLYGLTKNHRRYSPSHGVIHYNYVTSNTANPLSPLYSQFSVGYLHKYQSERAYILCLLGMHFVPEFHSLILTIQQLSDFYGLLTNEVFFPTEYYELHYRLNEMVVSMNEMEELIVGYEHERVIHSLLLSEYNLLAIRLLPYNMNGITTSVTCGETENKALNIVAIAGMTIVMTTCSLLLVKLVPKCFKRESNAYSAIMRKKLQ